MRTSFRSFRAVAAITVVATFALIVLGAVIRATNSGLSCPDWPSCYGYWVPTPAKLATVPDIAYTYTQVMYEWVHRFIAGIVVGPLVVVLFFWALAKRRANPRPFTFALVAALLLVFQGLLGGFTVLDKNSPWSVALHLSNAQLVMAALIGMIVSAGRPANSRLLWTEPVGRGLKALTLLVGAIALSTVASGAMMAKNGASLACSTWPLCDGAVIPDMSDPLIMFHFGHRVLALITALGILLLALFGLARRRYVPGFARDVTVVLLLVVVQVLLGAFVVWLEVPVWIAAVHQGMGVLVFAGLVVTFWHAIYGPTTSAGLTASGQDIHAALSGA